MLIRNRRFSLLCLLTLVLAFSSALQAFEFRKGDSVSVSADETLGDDLYVAGGDITIDGVVNGDVVVFGKTVRINGKINGAVFSAAQTIIINGTITGSTRIAGSVLYLGEKSKVSGDILSAGYSLELKQGASVGRDLLFAGGQILVSGDVTRNLTVASGGLEIAGSVGGNVLAKVGEAGKSLTAPQFMPQPAVPAPTVALGITVSPKAKIGGDLNYTQSKELAFPVGVVEGKIIFDQREIHEAAQRDRSQSWLAAFLRSLIGLIVTGLLLMVLFPRNLRDAADAVIATPGKSFVSGLLAFGIFLLSLILISIATTFGALLFGILTLGSLSGAILGIGFFSVVGVILAFVLVATFVAKIVVGVAIGQWILRKLNSPLADNKFAPMLVGVFLLSVGLSLLCLSFIPGAIGGLVKFVVTLFGLGALWIRLKPQKPMTLP